MFANFIEEECTGTGDTIELAGVTVANRPAFGDAFSDGDPVGYFIEDSGGTKLAAGVGAYVSATDDIIRNDMWSWDGTTYTKHPSSNITLSGGTHIIRCDASAMMLLGMSGSMKTSGDDIFSSHVTAFAGAASVTLTANRQYSLPFHLTHPEDIGSINVGVKTAQAGSTTEIGISRMIAGESDTDYLESGAIDTTVTSNKTGISFTARTLTPGWYVMHIVSTHAIAVERIDAECHGWSPFCTVLGGDRNSVGSYKYKDSVTSGSLTADPSTVSSLQYRTDSPSIWMSR